LSRLVYFLDLEIKIEKKSEATESIWLLRRSFLRNNSKRCEDLASANSLGMAGNNNRNKRKTADIQDIQRLTALKEKQKK
jgi:hypothetical protein